MDFWRVQVFHLLNVRNHNVSFPNSPRSTHARGIFQVKLSYQIGGALAGLLKKSDGIQPLQQTEWLGLEMVLRVAFHKVFSRLPGGLQHLADSNSTQENQPAIKIQACLQQHSRRSFLYSS